MIDDAPRPAQGHAAGAGPASQIVLARDGGYAYGVIGGDMHVYEHGGPVYLLLEHRSGPGAEDAAALTVQPSRMLDARSRVVGFTGRADDLAALSDWRDNAGRRLSVLWFHGPGGQGKTRIAGEFADRSAAAGWKVVTAEHGAGAMPPPAGSQDMGIGDARGLLLVVDYADRWPLTHLNWLFNNSLLRSSVPTRVLLLARSATMWPPVRHGLQKSFRADTRSRALGPLDLQAGSGSREAMFAAARDSFAAAYGLADPSAVGTPAELHRPEFGLVLALHMAALVAVDAHARGAGPPESMVELSGYLMDREREHWTQLFENASAGLDYRTPPSTMHRVVFTAILTGALSYRRGVAALGAAGLSEADRLLLDHRTCYPPPSQTAVLEPLYPDRFAEDLLAVSLPGHAVADHPPAIWAEATAEALLSDADDGPPPEWAARALTFLASAAAPDRWPHVAGHVEALLRTDPALALAAGGDVLTRLAELDVSPEVLEAVESRFPARRDTDLDAGIAALGERLARHRVAADADPDVHGREYRLLALRMSRAGRREDALAAAETAVAAHRRLVQQHVQAHALELAESLARLGRAHQDAGNWRQALRSSEEAVELSRRHGAEGPEFALALCQLAELVVIDKRWGEAVALSEEAVRRLRPRTVDGGADAEADLAYALAGLGNLLEGIGRMEAAVEAKREAVETYRRLAEVEPGTYGPECAMAQSNLAATLHGMRKPEEGIALAERSAALFRGLAAGTPAAFEPDLAAALSNLLVLYWDAGRCRDAAAAAEEASGLCGRLARDFPALYEDLYADVLVHHARCLAHNGHWRRAVRAKALARAIGRRRARAREDGRDPMREVREEADLHRRRDRSWALGRNVWTPDQHWVTLLDQAEVWQDAYDRRHRLDDMSPRYCRNVERFILEQASGIVDVLIRTDSDEPSEWWSNDTPDSWLRRKPLIRALGRRKNGQPARAPVCHCGYEFLPGWSHDHCHPGIIVD